MKNEEDILPYFLRHYSTFADKIFIINDHSTDRTVEIAKANSKVDVLDFEYERGLNENDFSNCFQDSYKKYSRGIADWVMCVDADEFIWNKDVLGKLKREREDGKRVIKATGYNMVSETYPTTNGQIYEECFMGICDNYYHKTVVFDPALDIEFMPGRHKTKLPEGVAFYRVGLSLLHYKYLSYDHVIKKIDSWKNTPSFNAGQVEILKRRAACWFTDEAKKRLTKII